MSNNQSYIPGRDVPREFYERQNQMYYQQGRYGFAHPPQNGQPYQMPNVYYVPYPAVPDSAPAKKNSRSVLRTIVRVVLALFLLSMGLSLLSVGLRDAASSASSREGQETLIESDPVVLTLEEFNQIQNGMSYSDVVAIIGGEGVLTSESSVGGTTMELFSWEGTSLGANGNVTFMNGKVTAKAQLGLS